ncbi:hypothetical protein SAMN05421636_106217 [Pricia antarctica]|uniref:Uncharacterized protein n=1 Tax=Pricia antarctica TaxID=641691 RepID=A0A1G7EJC8_9FLAO|nr:hypothetical protein [Pricia antarctica]SDE63782.1 hypothetical protein SAMN05421636_106217 [Pricia antarctica]
MSDGNTFRAEAYYKEYGSLVKYNTKIPRIDSNFNNFGTGYASGLDIFWTDNKSIKNLDYWVSYGYLDTQRTLKKNTIIILFLTTSLPMSAQNKYTDGMQRAPQLWGEQKTTLASNLFERIAMAEEYNWLPYHYAALVNTTASFGESDKKILTQQLEKAKEFNDIAKNLSPANPELLVMEALINTAWIAFDGATYGMTLTGKNTQLYQKALQLAPKKPRVVFSKAEWDLGSARYSVRIPPPIARMWSELWNFSKPLKMTPRFTQNGERKGRKG